MNILITGGTGFLGKHLLASAKAKGYSTSILSRKVKDEKDAHSFFWNPDEQMIDENALKEADCIIHLAGASIAEGRWTEKRKKEIIDSRVKSGELLYEYLKTNKSRTCGIKTFISPSGIGIYGNTGDAWVDENATPSNDFLAQVSKEWEAVAHKIATLGIRIVILRIGIVLAKDGGALPVLAKPVKLFAGAALGSGNQYMPWIHVDDLCSIFLKATEDVSTQGVYNAVAPNPTTDKEFIKTLAAVLKKPLILPGVPAFALKLLLGEKASIVLEGQRASPNRIQSAGFQFRFAEVKEALQNIYGN